MKRTGSRQGIMVLIALTLLGAAACFQVGNTTSVSVDLELASPWGAATIGEQVPVGYGW